MEYEYSQEKTTTTDDSDNELLNALRPKRNYTKEMIAAGATPLLVGFLAGGVGDGAAVAAQGIETIRKEEIEDDKLRAKSISEMLKERRKSKSEKSQLRPMFNPETGKTEYAVFRPDTEEIIPTGIVPGFSPKVITSPEGEQYSANLGAGAQGIKELKLGTQFPEAANLTPNFIKTVAPKASEKYIMAIKPLKKDLMDLKKAYSQLNSSGLLPQKVGLEFLIKSTQGGRMSDEDRKQILGHVSKIETIKETVEREKYKALPSRLLREAKESVRELIRLSGKSAQYEAEDIADMYSRSDEERQYFLKKFKSSMFEDK